MKQNYTVEPVVVGPALLDFYLRPAPPPTVPRDPEPTSQLLIRFNRSADCGVSSLTFIQSADVSQISEPRTDDEGSGGPHRFTSLSQSRYISCNRWSFQYFITDENVQRIQICPKRCSSQFVTITVVQNPLIGIKTLCRVLTIVARLTKY